MTKKYSNANNKRIDCILLPSLTNSPLKNKNDKQALGKLRLRKNVNLDFIENYDFDSHLITYDEDYQNSLIHSEFFVNHMNSVMGLLKKILPKNSRVVEVGCGKGDFLEMLNNDGYFNATGYDATYEGTNEKVFKRYLNESDKIEADLVIVRHVLEHIEKPFIFIQMIKKIFGKGLIYIEVPNYDWIVENKAFFDITYEHVNYFSQKSLTYFFNDVTAIAGLCFENQYQYIIANIERISTKFKHNYDEGIWEFIDFYKLFPNIKNRINEIQSLLEPESHLYVWGAASKGCMFLVHCKNLGILIDRVRFAIDINPNKQNKFLPISLIPIKSKEEFFKIAKKEDLVIITNPNYKNEITKEIDSRAPIGLSVICL